MDFVNGRIMEDTTLADQSPEDRAAIYKSLAEVLAALHKVDVNGVGLERFGRPTGFVQRQMKTWGGEPCLFASALCCDCVSDREELFGLQGNTRRRT